MRLPETLCAMKPPVKVTWHKGQHFQNDAPDDYILSVVGRKNWVAIGQDYKWHNIPAEAAAIRQHAVRCFYLPCANDGRWVTLCHFVRRHEKMIELANNVPGPFIYRLAKNGQFYPVPLP